MRSSDVVPASAATRGHTCFQHYSRWLSHTLSRSRSGAVDTRLLPRSGMDPPVVWMKFSNRRSLQPRSYKMNATSRNRVKAGRLVKANWSFSKKSGTSTERMRKKRSLASCNHDFLRVQACQFFVGCVKSFFKGPSKPQIVGRPTLLPAKNDFYKFISLHTPFSTISILAVFVVVVIVATVKSCQYNIYIYI